MISSGIKMAQSVIRWYLKYNVNPEIIDYNILAIISGESLCDHKELCIVMIL